MGQNASHDSLKDDDPGQFQLPHQLISVLGKGTNGTVYAAEQTDGKRIVVKRILLSHKKKRAKQQTYQLRNEIDAVMKLSHQHIVRYFGWNIEAALDAQDAMYFRIFMEMCEGGTLQGRARKGLRFFHLRECTRQILEGIKYLHGAGVVHGELTSDNIFLAVHQEFFLKIGGFGKLSSFPKEKSAPARKPSVSSSSLHLAPITDNGVDRKNDPKADIWSIACILVEMLHEGETETFESTEDLLELMDGSLNSVVAWFLGVDSLLGNSHLPYFTKNQKVVACVQFLKQCLQKDSKERPNASELLKSRFILADLGEPENTTEKELLDRYKITERVTDWLFQGVEEGTGTQVILTRRPVELTNWMDEFIAMATVVGYGNYEQNIPPHPQLLRRLGCWACRGAPTADVIEKMTVISCWEYREPFKLLERVIVESGGGFSLDGVKNYTQQIVNILYPIWQAIRTSPVGSTVVVLDLCSSYLLLNTTKTAVTLQPFLFPEVISADENRDWFVAGNIWDLGLLVLNMLQGKLAENREAGDGFPVIPQNMLPRDTEDFLQKCFSCFQPKRRGSAGFRAWTREPGVLTWTPEMLAAHPFLLN